MFPKRRIIQTLVMAGGLLLLAPTARVAWAQNVYNATYFDTDPTLVYPIRTDPLPTIGSPDRDNTVRMVNPTFHVNAIRIPGDTLSQVGGLCAMIYVFDDDQEPIECCGCPISNDGVITLSVEDDLTSNPLTGPPFAHTHGVIEVVSADPNAGAAANFCDPTGASGAIVPDATIREWITHEPAEKHGPLGYPAVGQVSDNLFENLTEVNFLAAPLSKLHLADLQIDCGFLVGNGSRQGICFCGDGPENPGETTGPPTTPTLPEGTFE